MSAVDQRPELPIDALESAGCTRTFVERVSSAAADRVELSRALDHLRAGDALVVWKLDRLGRSLRELIDIIGGLDAREIGFISLTESIDTTSRSGRLVFHIFASLAEFERDLIREHTHAGLAAARARGRTGGRPTVMTPSKIAAARRLLAEVDDSERSVYTVSDVAKTLSVSRASVYRAFARAGTQVPPTMR